MLAHLVKNIVKNVTEINIEFNKKKYMHQVKCNYHLIADTKCRTYTTGFVGVQLDYI